MSSLEKAVDALVAEATRLHKERQEAENLYLQEADILLILAWQKIILARYEDQYRSAPLEIQKAIDKAKENARDSVSYDAKDDIENRLVMAHPPAVVSATCFCCQGQKEYMSFMDNVAYARPLWTNFYAMPNYQPSTTKENTNG